MIFDLLDQLEYYSDQIPALKIVGELLDREIALNPVGFYTTRDPKLNYEIQEYRCDLKERDFQIDKDFIQIHILVKGKEIQGFSHRDLSYQVKEYKNGIANIKGEPVGALQVNQGRFTIFFPNEPFKCGLSVGEDEEVKKIIFRLAFL